MELTDKEKLKIIKENRDKHAFLESEVGEWLVEQSEKAQRYERELSTLKDGMLKVTCDELPHFLFNSIVRILKEASDE